MLRRITSRSMVRLGSEQPTCRRPAAPSVRGPFYARASARGLVAYVQGASLKATGSVLQRMFSPARPALEQGGRDPMNASVGAVMVQAPEGNSAARPEPDHRSRLPGPGLQEPVELGQGHQHRRRLDRPLPVRLQRPQDRQRRHRLLPQQLLPMGRPRLHRRPVRHRPRRRRRRRRSPTRPQPGRR